MILVAEACSRTERLDETTSADGSRLIGGGAKSLSTIEWREVAAAEEGGGFSSSPSAPGSGTRGTPPVVTLIREDVMVPQTHHVTKEVLHDLHNHVDGLPGLGCLWTRSMVPSALRHSPTARLRRWQQHHSRACTVSGRRKVWESPLCHLCQQSGGRLFDPPRL